jgi:hypothetical protein
MNRTAGGDVRTGGYLWQLRPPHHRAAAHQERYQPQWSCPMAECRRFAPASGRPSSLTTPLLAVRRASANTHPRRPPCNSVASLEGASWIICYAREHHVSTERLASRIGRLLARARLVQPLLRACRGVRSIIPENNGHLLSLHTGQRARMRARWLAVW